MRGFTLVLLAAVITNACGDSAGRPPGAPKGNDTNGPDDPSPPANDSFVVAAPGRTTCSPIPEKLTEVAGGFSSIAVDGDDVFALNEQLQRFSRGGGAFELPVPMGRASLGSRAVVSVDDVFFTKRDGIGGALAPIAIFRTDRALAKAPARIFLQPRISNLLVHGNFLYFRLDSGAEVRIDRISRDGLDYQPGFAAGSVIGMTMDDQFLYWASDTRLFRRALTGTPPEQIANADRMNVFGNDATHVYAISLAEPTTTLTRIPKTGGAVERLLFSDAVSDLAAAVDGNFVYVADSDGSVFRMLKSGGTAQRLGGLGAYDDDDYTPVLAFDDQNVYFQAGPPPTSQTERRTAANNDPLWLLRMCK